MSECDYCHSGRELLATDNGSLYIVHDCLVESVTWDHQIDMPSDEVNATTINYCPMCGRKLGADEI